MFLMIQYAVVKEHGMEMPSSIRTHEKLNFCHVFKKYFTILLEFPKIKAFTLWLFLGANAFCSTFI
ncbi:MAG: hypothetical protein DBY04_00895 [Clostridiales bacterium]|nr:MAG: hypothetical protein DBY04_00895 [Clostridiales bacterium]